LFYFLLVLYSTWLTRSGVLSNFSVHSFSASKASPFLLFFLSVYFFASVILYSKRIKHLSGDAIKIPVMDWRTLTVYGIIVILLFSMIIMIGTSLPLLSAVFMRQATSATTDYYNNFSGPFGLLIMVLMIASTVLVLSKKILKLENAVLGIVAVFIGTAINAGFTENPAAYIFTIVSFFLILRSAFDIVKAKSVSIVPSRLAHLGIGILAAGIITSNFHTITVQKKLEQGKENAIGEFRISFDGFREGKESSLKFTIRSDSRLRQAETAYYIDEKTESLYREPYIISGFLHDTYMIPEIYESGVDAVSQLLLSKGQEAEIGGIKVRFIEFQTEHMTSGEPVTRALLSVNGMKLAPAIQFKRGAINHIDRAIPGTDRSLSLKEIDATSKKIFLIITPGKNTKIPPDTVILSLTKKRLIWLVWTGAILISLGGCFAFARALRIKND
jgi:cytochrome c-type biogenesis protein CcmF